jgi:hypothetical protein
MKTLSTLSLFLFFVTMASAQINAGSALITGTVSYSMTTVDSDLSPGETEETNLFLQLTSGYFVGENFVLGLNVGYSMSESSSFVSVIAPEKRVTETNLVTIGPFARYYYMFDEKAGFFGQADIGFGFGKRQVEEEPGVDISRIEGVLRPGMTYFFSEKWAVEGKFGYIGYSQNKEEYTTADQNFEVTTSNLQVSFNFTTLSFGLAFYPGRNRE